MQSPAPGQAVNAGSSSAAVSTTAGADNLAAINPTIAAGLPLAPFPDFPRESQADIDQRIREYQGFIDSEVHPIRFPANNPPGSPVNSTPAPGRWTQWGIMQHWIALVVILAAVLAVVRLKKGSAS